MVELEEPIVKTKTEEKTKEKIEQTAILQLGYMRNKNRYRFVTYERDEWLTHFQHFLSLHARLTFQ